MSTLTADEEQEADLSERVYDTATRIQRAVFGDRVGLLVFVCSLLLFAVFWEVTIRINDNYTLVNNLVGLANGHLDVRSAPYSQTFYGGSDPFDTPGMHVVDGKLYGRNYGQLVFALPFVYLFRGIFAVTDPRIAMAGLWSLGLLAAVVLVGRQYDRPTMGAVAGSVLALATFALNAALATPLEASQAALIAFHFSTMVFAALTGVLGYRLLTRLYDRRVGVATGLAILLASPVAYWSNIAKRHTLTAFFVMAALYTLYRSRTAETDREALGFHLLTYVWPGLMAWTHAPEGALLLFAVGVADLATGGIRDVRTLAAIGAAVFVSLLPFFVTNLLISGNPVVPPRFLPDYGPALSSSVETTDAATGGGRDVVSDDIAGSSVDTGPLEIAVRAVGRVAEGLLRPITDPEAVYHTFVRSGYIDGVSVKNASQAIDLSVLESAPLLGAFVAVPVVAARRLRETRLGDYLARPVAVLDMFALVYTVGLLALYLPSLPIHAMVTVRYLHPIYVLGIYAVVRLPAVRAVLRERGRLVAWVYLGGVFVGGQLVLAVLVILETSAGEAAQAHALLNLGAVALLAAWVLVATLWDHDDGRVLTAGAVSLALAAAATTVFVLLSRLYHTTLGEFLLPFVPVF